MDLLVSRDTVRTVTATSRRYRGEGAKSAQRREEILEAALEVFSAYGFWKASLRDVADRAGMSQAGVLHHFANKNELLTALLEQRDAENTEWTDAAAGDGLTRLRAVADVAERNHRVPRLVELRVLLSGEAASPEHPFHEYLVDRYARVNQRFREAFEEVAREGRLKAGVDPASAARKLTALMDGLQLQWLLDRDSVDVTAELRDYMQSLLNVRL